MSRDIGLWGLVFVVTLVVQRVLFPADELFRSLIYAGVGTFATWALFTIGEWLARR